MQEDGLLPVLTQLLIVILAHRGVVIIVIELHRMDLTVLKQQVVEPQIDQVRQNDWGVSD